MPTMGMRYKSILRVALWSTFGSVLGWIFSGSSLGRIWTISDVFSLGEGGSPDSNEADMRNDQGKEK